MISDGVTTKAVFATPVAASHQSCFIATPIDPARSSRDQSQSKYEDFWTDHQFVRTTRERSKTLRAMQQEQGIRLQGWTKQRRNWTHFEQSSRPIQAKA